jgi:hypothetical protein
MAPAGGHAVFAGNIVQAGCGYPPGPDLKVGELRERDPTMSHQQHSSEPEIIPPPAGTRLRDRDAMRISVNERGTRRIYVTRLGPFSLILLALGICLLAALVLVLAIGTFLIWIPVVALLVTATMISALLRQLFHRWH